MDLNQLFLSSIVFGPGIVFARVALSPAFKAAKRSRQPVQYGLADLAALMVYLSMALGLGYVPLSEYYPMVHYLFVSSACLFTVSIWLIAVRTAARAGLTNAQKRFGFLILVPLVYVAGLFASPALLMFLVELVYVPALFIFPALLTDIFLTNHVGGFISLAVLVAGRVMTTRMFNSSVAKRRLLDNATVGSPFVTNCASSGDTQSID